MKKTVKILVPVLMALLIIASIFWYLFRYDRAFTRDTLLGQARFQDTHGNSRISSWFYNAAYTFSDKDENVAIELANQYKADGNFTKAEYTLTHAINSGATAELYTALSLAYAQQDKLMDCVNMLDNIPSPEIRAELDALRPTAPAANYAPGFYSEYIDVYLNSDGTIFYTTDGTFPSIESPAYSGPITLSAGETTIHAVSVTNNGLVSPLTVLSYTVTGVIEEVVFHDSTMEAAIREQIGVSDSKTVYTNQLWEITEFTVPEGVVNYEDLRMLPYLKSLTMQNLTLDNLDPLSSLTMLETLDLTASRFPAEALSVVAGLPKLTKLVMNECGLSTIADLAGAPALTYLDLSNNTVRNLEPLSAMAGLKEVYLQHNAVRDLTAFIGLTELEKLDVSYNSLTDLSPISGCFKLSWLSADNNSISSLSGLDSLPVLNHLSVDYNDLTDVSILSKCTELTNLSIASNDISDIAALKTLTRLKIFDFSSNKIPALPAWPDGCPLEKIDGSYNALESIDGLENMDSLAYVYMDYNLLTNIDALADNFCLVQVNVFGNEIEDVSALRDHDIIVNYDPT